MPFATNGAVQIYWRATGQGQPLLLIMGLGYSSDMWYHIEAGLAEHFRVIVFDNRGIGKSPVVPGPHLVPTMAADAAAVLDAAGERSAFVFGLSMGGFIAQELALANPERVRALILGCTACGGAHVVPAKPIVIETLMARAHMPPEQGIRAMLPYVYDAGTPPDRIESDLAMRLANYPDPEVYLGQIAGISLWQSCDRLHLLKMPTLILHGDGDLLIPPENGHLLHSHIANSRLIIIPRASHVFTTDQPETSIRHITDFLVSQKSTAM